MQLGANVQDGCHLKRGQAAVEMATCAFDIALICCGRVKYESQQYEMFLSEGPFEKCFCDRMQPAKSMV